MPAATIESAALFLVAARRARRAGARLPESLRPPDVETALAIQQRVTELLRLPIGGWKCSLPAADRPVAVAPIYAPTICERSPCAILPIGGMARVEPEIAFAMAHDLPQRTSPYTEAEVLDAVREPRLVLELIGPRYADPAVLTFPEVLAVKRVLAYSTISQLGYMFMGESVHNYTAGIFHLTTHAYFKALLFLGAGAVIHALQQRLDELAIVIEGGGTRLHAVQGRHGDGHPLKPLVWLANFLATRGEGLRAGQIVTTGSYCGVIDVPLNKALTVNFGTLGKLSVEFNAAA